MATKLTVKKKVQVENIQADEPRVYKKHVVDRIHEARLRHQFMTQAMINLIAHTDSAIEGGTGYGNEILSGYQFIMDDIADELQEIVKTLHEAKS